MGTLRVPGTCKGLVELDAPFQLWFSETEKGRGMPKVCDAFVLERRSGLGVAGCGGDSLSKSMEA